MRVKKHGFEVDVTCERCGAVITLDGPNNLIPRKLRSKVVPCFVCPDCYHVTEVVKPIKPDTDTDKLFADFDAIYNR